LTQQGGTLYLHIMETTWTMHIEPRSEGDWDRAAEEAREQQPGEVGVACEAMLENDEIRVRFTLDPVDYSDLAPGAWLYHCQRYTVEHLSGPPLEDVNLPFRELWRQAEEGARVVMTRRGRPKFVATLTGAERRDLKDRERALARTPAKGEPITEEQLQHIVELYRHRLAIGSRRPTQDVADMLELSRSTVARWLVDARKRGLLTERGKGRYS
jgi:antitoxin (DNA-binding transcriptional repressor) of toxin-antitoxin stability system